MRQLVASTQYVSRRTLRAQLRCSERDLRKLLRMPGIRQGSGGLIELYSARQVYALMRQQEDHKARLSRVYA